MNRRDFLQYSGASSLISTGLILPDNLLAGTKMPAFNTFRWIGVKPVKPKR